MLQRLVAEEQEYEKELQIIRQNLEHYQAYLYRVLDNLSRTGAKMVVRSDNTVIQTEQLIDQLKDILKQHRKEEMVTLKLLRNTTRRKESLLRQKRRLKRKKDFRDTLHRMLRMNKAYRDSYSEF